MGVFDRSDFTHIFAYLDTNGDGSGVFNGIGDYSSSPADFFIQPPVNAVWAIERMIVSIQGDCGRGGYGQEAALVNGIHIKTTNSAGDTLLDLDCACAIKDEFQWGALCFDVSHKETNEGNTWVFARWTFGKSGLPVVLRHQDRLVVTLNDDFEHLSAHRFQVQGAIANYLYGS